MPKCLQIVIMSARSIWRFRLRSGLTLLSATLGVGGVVVSVNYAAAGRQQVFEQVRRIGTNILVVTPNLSRSVGGRARTGDIVKTLVESDYSVIRRQPDVVRWSATAISGFLLKHEDFSKNTTVVGCEPAYFRIKNWGVSDGELFDSADLRRSARVVLLGSTVARDLFEAASPIGQRLLINRIPFQVTGVLEERGQGLDVVNEDNEVFVPLTTAQRRLMNIDYFSSIVVEVDEWDHLPRAAQTLDSILEERHRVSQKTPADFQIQNQKVLLDTQIESSQKLGSLVRTIGLSGLIVSGLGIFAICWISVKERSVEIGTRRALGATASNIFFQVLFEVACVSTVGSLTGLAAGWFVTKVVATRTQLPFVFDWDNAYFALAASIFMNLTCSFWPSRKGARIEPIRALKYE